MTENTKTNIEAAVTLLVVLFLAVLAIKLFLALLPFIIIGGVAAGAYFYYTKNKSDVDLKVQEIRQRIGY